MAATFDDDLIEQVGVIVGTEARAYGNSGHSGIDYWTPNINPYKDPRWGRGSETPGEDTLRIKGYVASLVRGLEGNSTQRRIIATCKHYAANDLEAWGGTAWMKNKMPSTGVIPFCFLRVVLFTNISSLVAFYLQPTCRSGRYGLFMVEKHIEKLSRQVFLFCFRITNVVCLLSFLF